MSSGIEVAVIGAGPYGLSIAAHLRAKGIPFRIFGEPMRTWATHMPEGMCLKSDGFASSLYAPNGGYSLKKFCTAQGLPYRDLGLPVPLDTFVAYGRAFQREMVPTLEQIWVTALRAMTGSFLLELSSGETLRANRVVVATGISHFEYMPPVLSALPIELCSHSAAHHELSRFRNREVIVVGAGASATDLAGLLHAQGASVQLIARRPVVFHERGSSTPSLWSRISKPNLGLGPNLRSAAFTMMPGLFRLAPLQLRLSIVRKHLGPAGGWFTKAMVVGKVAIHSGCTVRRAENRGERVILHCEGDDGRDVTVEADYVIAATGYRVALPRLNFLDPGLVGLIETEDGSPVLSRSFESSVSGLYFVGLASAVTFGPLLRFALGARFTASRIVRHLNSVIRVRAPVHATAVESTPTIGNN